MQTSARPGMRTRRSVHDKARINNARDLVSSSAPNRSMFDKLPLLIKGKFALNITKTILNKPGVLHNEPHFPILASAAETDKGLIRNYNEDRYSIIQDNSNPSAPVYLFAVYDGHGGSRCADFLKQHLQEFVLKDLELRSDAKNALVRSFIKAENNFIEEAKRSGMDRSGSCAIVCLIFKDKCFVANLGDSRAVLSANKGNRVFPLSRDHKPIDKTEMARIEQAGGYVYQSNNLNVVPAVLGPFRVFPGRLSVSRTIGDIYAKLPQYGGNPNVIIAVPEVKNFRLVSEHDFIIIASDGIFDRVDNAKAVECVWESFRENYKMGVEQKCTAAARKLIQLAIERKSMDNLTVIVIALAGLQES